MRGKVYKAAAGGYVVVTDLDREQVTYSPLFWRDKIDYFQASLNFFNAWHKPLTVSMPNPTIQARFDHELMRRLK